MMMKPRKLLLVIGASLCMGAPVMADTGTSEMMVSPPGVDKIKEQDFDAVVNSTIPMTPEQITRLKSYLDAQQRAAAKPVKKTILRSRQIDVDVAPGSPVPIAQTTRGKVSTLVFLDRFGEPWPISYYKDGDAENFVIEEVRNDLDKEGADKQMATALTVVPNTYYDGNITVFLKGLPSPISVELRSGGDYTDTRLDLRINRMGPESHSATVLGAQSQGGLPQYDSAVLSILGGVPPKGYKLKILEGRLGKSYTGEKYTYIRSHFKLISPQSKHLGKSPDGTMVYRIPVTSVVLMLIDGSIRRVRVN